MLRRLPLALAVLAACSEGAVATSIASGRPCAETDVCEAGTVCYQGKCRPLCAQLSDCPRSDRCLDGVCQPGAGECADHGDCDSPPGPCYTIPGSCSAGSCSYVQAPEGGSCDDRNECTENDVCSATGFCRGTLRACVTPPPSRVISGPPAKVVSYSSPGSCSSGECVYPERLFDCSDVTACQASPCTVVNCDDAAGCLSSGACQDGNCLYGVVPAGQSCNDADACTSADNCDGQGNCVGDPKVCNPTNDCVENGRCEQDCGTGTCVGVCVFDEAQDESVCTINDAPGVCGDGECHSLPCFIDGTPHDQDEVHPQTSCQLCLPTLSQNDWSNLINGSECTDAGADGRCVDGWCDYNHCVIGGTVYEHGAARPGSPCDVCRVETSKSSWTGLSAGSPCEDAFGPGVCSGTGACRHDACSISGAFVTAGTGSPDGCGICDPTYSLTWWKPLSSGCSSCTAAGQTCIDPFGPGVCESAGGACRHDGCGINGAFYVAGSKDAGGCYVCDPAHSMTAWKTLAAGTGCPSSGRCQEGVCYASSCYLDGQIVANNASRSGNVCQYCDAANNSWALRHSVACPGIAGCTCEGGVKHETLCGNSIDDDGDDVKDCSDASCLGRDTVTVTQCNGGCTCQLACANVGESYAPNRGSYYNSTYGYQCSGLRCSVTNPNYVWSLSGICGP